MGDGTDEHLASEGLRGFLAPWGFKVVSLAVLGVWRLGFRV